MHAVAGDEFLIEGDGLGGDAGPGEVLLYAAAAGFAHLLGERGVFEQRGEPGGEVAGELVGVEGEAGDGVLVEGDEVAGFAIDDDFEDAAGGAGDDGRTAGHGFEIDDAEGLVDRGAAEDARVASRAGWFRRLVTIFSIQTMCGL